MTPETRFPSGTQTPLVLRAEDYARVAEDLRASDELLADGYPGDDGSRQPVHSVYVPGNKFTPVLPAAWGQRALAAVDEQGGLEWLASELGFAEAGVLAELAGAKLVSEPIEDLRLDFEDGYGSRSDDVEDRDAARCGAAVAGAVAAGTAPPFIGIRFKSLEAATRERGLRTVDLFLGSLLRSLAGRALPEGLVLTLPKVSTVAQVEAMAYICGRVEEAYGLPAGRLRFEVQVETPQVILGADGTAAVARLLHAAPGRVSGLHYGTYDYSAAIGIAPEYQSLEHPAADYAKTVMQAAAAGTGVRLSDGSTIILPVGDAGNVLRAWKLHARLVARSLEAGFYQGWDLHPAQLPTRYLATHAFYRRGFPAAAERLGNYVHQRVSTVLDEPATARALARFIQRAAACGAVTGAEVSAAGVSPEDLDRLARPRETEHM
ncbi:DUF6986 family protein [Arthrobacter sp. NPDC055585]